MPPRDEDVFELHDDDIISPPKSSSPWKWIALGCGFFAVMFVVAVGVFVYRAVQLAKEFAQNVQIEVEKSTGVAVFREASNKISVHHGEVGFGNSDAAIKLAQAYSQQIAEMRDELFTKRKKPAKFSLSDGKFLVYCQLDGDRCAFLVHVPDLRKFDKDAKDYLGMVAWVTAQTVIKNSELATKPTDIALGLRGMLLYDRVLVGSLATADQDMSETLDIEQEGDDMKSVLYSYFEPPLDLETLTPVEEMLDPNSSKPSNDSPSAEGATKPEPDGVAPAKANAATETPTP